jgi:hypothetical protein
LDPMSGQFRCGGLGGIQKSGYDESQFAAAVVVGTTVVVVVAVVVGASVVVGETVVVVAIVVVGGTVVVVVIVVVGATVVVGGSVVVGATVEVVARVVEGAAAVSPAVLSLTMPPTTATPRTPPAPAIAIFCHVCRAVHQFMSYDRPLPLLRTQYE